MYCRRTEEVGEEETRQFGEETMMEPPSGPLSKLQVRQKKTKYYGWDILNFFRRVVSFS